MRLQGMAKYLDNGRARRMVEGISDHFRVCSVMLTVSNSPVANSLKSMRRETALQTIEAAAFVVCLDEAKPTNAEERVRKFLFGNGSNRWYDKSLQIVVCNNGISAIVCEHAALDGVSVEPLYKYKNDAILEFELSSHLNFSDNEIRSFHSPDRVSLLSNAPIDDHVQRFLESSQPATLKYSFAHAEIANFRNDFFSRVKCPVLSGVSLAILLANHRFFGYSPPTLETVSMAPFRKGRVEVHHFIQPRVADFLATATESSTPAPADSLVGCE